MAYFTDPTKRKEMMEKLQQAENAIKMQIKQMMALEGEGRAEQAKQLRTVIEMRATKLKQFKTHFLQAQAQAQAQLQKAQCALPSSSGAGTSSGPQPQQPNASEPGRPTPHMPAHQTPVPPPTAPGQPGQQTVHTTMTPDVAAQMQKLIEQNNRFPKQPSNAPQAPDAQPQRPGHWQGTLTWRGFDSETHARKDVHTRVILTCKEEQARLM